MNIIVDKKYNPSSVRGFLLGPSQTMGRDIYLL